MARPGFAAFVIFQLLNAASIAISQSGLGAAIGVDLQTSAGQRLSEAATGFEELNLTGGLSDLFGAITASLSALEGLFTGLFAAPEMLIQLGVPAWLTAFLFAPLAVLIGRDLIYFATSR